MIDVTGSLQIKNKTYQAVLSYKENGKWRTKWVSTKIKAVKGNKKKAEIELENIRIRFYEEINSDNTEDDKVLFIDFMKKWLKIAKPTLEESTFVGYRKLINGRMSTYFKDKNITLKNIKPHDIQDFYQYLLEAGLSGNTIARYHANIHKALEHAVKTDLILSNPANKTELPKKENYIANFYSTNEILTLLESVKNTKLETPVLLGCYYGLRRSEIIGLRWSAIDFDRKTITINHVVVDVSENKTKKLLKKDRTKTKSSTRTLPLLPDIEDYLLKLKTKQENNKKLFKSSYNQEHLDYICVTEMGDLINPDYVSHQFPKMLEKNKLRTIRFHDLRHSCASLLLDKRN